MTPTEMLLAIYQDVQLLIILVICLGIFELLRLIRWLRKWAKQDD